MEARGRAVEGWGGETEAGAWSQSPAKSIYYELKAEAEAGHLVSLRREWCTERPGIDPPNLLDFTRCVFGIEQVRSLLQRRGDTGRLIDELLASPPADGNESVASRSARPSGLHPSGIRSNRAADAEEACKIHLSGLDPNKRPRNKDEAFEAAKEAVKNSGELSGKAFERAWAASVPEAWQKGGRRKKSP
jgi:hypothetical protein